MKYSELIIQEVWEKGRASSDIDSSLWREDECGAWISRDDYGKTDSDFGWHIINVIPGGAATPDNLRPFHHRNGYDLANRKAKRYVTADRTGLATFERSFEPRNRSLS